MADERTLDALGIHPGLAVEVLTLDNNVTFQGRMEKVWDRALQISDPTGGELPPVLLNREVKLRCSPRETQVVILRGQICGSTRWMWKVDRLKIMHLQEHRGYFRQRVQVDTQVTCGERQAQCQIMDISAGGMMLKSKRPIPADDVMIQSRERFEVGDLLSVADARILPEELPFSFQCRVVREEKMDNRFVYGCQFEGLATREQDRLIRAIFTTQRKERLARQKRSGI